MYTGEKNNYSWLESENIEIHAFLKINGKLLENKYIAIASFDGGQLIPNKNEKQKGWYSKNKILYTQKIIQYKEIPYAGYDEWYIFNELTEIDIDEPFVNYGFFLHDPKIRLEKIDKTWDLKGIQSFIDNEIERQEKFWDRIEKIKPDIVIMESYTFMIVCKNTDLFNIIQNNLL